MIQHKTLQHVVLKAEVQPTNLKREKISFKKNHSIAKVVQVKKKKNEIENTDF